MHSSYAIVLFMLSSVEILILSAIQGISEFLPISSAAHLVLVSKYYSFVNQNLLIDICLHLGSLIAIIIYFRNDLFHFVKNKNFLIKIIFGTIPIIPAGYVLYKTGLIDQLRNLEVIGWTTLIFGIVLYISDKTKITKRMDENFTNRAAIFVGLFQVLALIPGVSRSGITISSGRILGFNRFDSAKISFLLSIPTLAAASILGIYNIYKEESIELNFLAVIAVIFSFIFSYITIALFLNFIRRFTLKVFVIYRIILAFLLLAIVYL
jgi:undecaprenyl-diphosphatase